MFAYIKFLGENIRLNRIIIVSPDTDFIDIFILKCH